MANRTITKTVRQYSAAPVPPDTMGKLQAVADGYCAVKNYVYQRYGGIRSISKLYPVYTIQNEMTKSGLRQALGLSGASFYPAVFEALVDLRNHWDKEMGVVGKRVRENGAFSDADRHYLRFLLSIDRIFAAVLNRQPFEVSEKIRERYEELSRSVDAPRLENYLRRQIRKIHARPKTGAADSFVATMDGYRYADHGIYLATTERRKRVFIPLTDNNRYTRQIEVRLFPEDRRIELRVPIEMRIREHADYRAEVGLAMGMKVMLTTHEGHTYGEDIEKYQQNLTVWMREEHDKYQKNRLANPGRKKYAAEKRRREGHLHSLHHEIPAREPAIRRGVRELLHPELAEGLYTQTTDAEMQGKCGGTRGGIRKRHRHRVQSVRGHRNQGRRNLLLPMRLFRAGKAERGAKRKKKRTERRTVTERSKTNVPDNPQGFTRKRPGNRFEIKKDPTALEGGLPWQCRGFNRPGLGEHGLP